MQEAPFAAVRQGLLDLGFVMRVEPGLVRFEHPGTNSWYVFRPHADDEPVNLPNLVGLRHNLDVKGLVPREQFEEWLRARLIAG